MASSSSSSSLDLVKYDVFLSFRGDTRDNFTSHLHSGLVRRGIRTFIDYRIDRGEELEQSLVEAIRGSSISVIIFSGKYADSRWCLNELVECMKCKEQGKQKVLPIFYKVDPSDAEHQTGSYEEAFKTYENDVKVDKNKIQEWRTYLKKAAYLVGWDSRNTGTDSILIEEIVKDILEKLGHPCLDYVEDLVGIQPQVENVESLLQIGTSDVRIVGLWGMGGIGKTTIARLIFDKSYCHFEGCCFLANVRENSLKIGLTKLRDEILVNVLNEGNTSMGTSNWRPTFVRRQLRHVRALIVLDDVDTFEQVEALAGKHAWYGAGSRIIVTSRDKHVFQDRVDEIYEVQALSKPDSLELFSLFAFKKRLPEGDMMGLSKKVVSYVKGIPLGLKVLGVFLYRKSKLEWQSALSKLQKIPNVKIQDVLKISYQGLDFFEQQTFLHIACFFKGVSRSYVEELLDACGFHTPINLRVLSDKCLIDISNDVIEMHDLLQEMGRQIVREESLKEPGKRSRLWDHKDIYHVLTKNTGSEAIEGIQLDKSKISGLCLPPTAFAKMKQIKLLIFYGSKHGIQFPEGLESLPDELRHFQWNFYPLKSLPSNFRPDNLVLLNMSESQIERLWTGIQDLLNLIAIILCGCKNLIELPDLSRASNLRTINCQGCVSLTEVSASILNLDKLVDMNFRHCRKITSVPCPRSIKFLDLLGCSKLEKFPEVGDIEYLDLSGSIFERESSATSLHHGNLPSDVSQVNFAYKWKMTETCVYITEITCTWDENSFNRASIWPDELGLTKQTRLPQSQGHLKVYNQGDRDFPNVHGTGVYHHNTFAFYNHSKLDHEKIAGFLRLMYQRIQLMGVALLFPKELSTFQLGSFGCYHQSEGSSIAIQLPQNWLRDDFVGFTLLAILALQDNNERDDYFYVRWECQFNSACGETKRVSMPLRHSPFEYGNAYLMYLSEPQVTSDDWLYESEWNKATFEAYLETSCAKPCYKLKSILIRLMYIGDEVENPTMTQPSYSYDPTKMSLRFSFCKAEESSIGKDPDDYHNDEKDDGKCSLDAEGAEPQGPFLHFRECYFGAIQQSSRVIRLVLFGSYICCAILCFIR
ncbi:disease resistance protein RPV1 isoform X2 [Hevea brasiliensis]|uniref:disease resistance protein RPV1 isoform X2 n=1 Tax=Hevea brasiliensis TaxID=3981 RepID=UPI0025D6D1B5|nr:disease resistance protein RPV1 isoform X2 [Hevea brasiliensis]